MSAWNDAKNTGRIFPMNRYADSPDKKSTSLLATSALVTRQGVNYLFVF